MPPIQKLNLQLGRFLRVVKVSVTPVEDAPELT